MLSNVTYTAEIITSLKKPFFIFKFIAALFICSNFQAIAGANAQNITLTVKNAEIGKVLDNIEKQSDYRFLFNSRLKELSKKLPVFLIIQNLKRLLNRYLQAPS